LIKLKINTPTTANPIIVPPPTAELPDVPFAKIVITMARAMYDQKNRMNAKPCKVLPYVGKVAGILDWKAALYAFSFSTTVFATGPILAATRIRDSSAFFSLSIMVFKNGVGVYGEIPAFLLVLGVRAILVLVGLGLGLVGQTAPFVGTPCEPRPGTRFDFTISDFGIFRTPEKTSCNAVDVLKPSIMPLIYLSYSSGL
jgi:hypothetical protein